MACFLQHFRGGKRQLEIWHRFCSSHTWRHRSRVLILKPKKSILDHNIHYKGGNLSWEQTSAIIRKKNLQVRSISSRCWIRAGTASRPCCCPKSMFPYARACGAVAVGTAAVPSIPNSIGKSAPSRHLAFILQRGQNKTQPCLFVCMVAANAVK